MDGARGVLMGAVACAPDATIGACREIWDLGRDEGERADRRVDAAPAGLHVVGSTR